jgi:hypothetical protein
METLLRDVRHGLRMLFRAPMLMVTIVLTLALGIGANTSIFSLVNAVMLNSLPVKNPQELVVVGDPALAHRRADGSPPASICTPIRSIEISATPTTFSPAWLSQAKSTV